VIEAAVSVEAIKRLTVPASLGFKQLGVESQINVAGNHCPLEGPRNVLTLKSGFGGVNAALAISGVPGL
jgi:3-oxoacyl-(acyl-carrier-protein) synthase